MLKDVNLANFLVYITEMSVLIKKKISSNILNLKNVVLPVWSAFLVSLFGPENILSILIIMRKRN